MIVGLRAYLAAFIVLHAQDLHLVFLVFQDII